MLRSEVSASSCDEKGLTAKKKGASVARASGNEQKGESKFLEEWIERGKDKVNGTRE